MFFSCTQVPDRVHLARFSDQMLKENILARQYISEFDSWEKAFSSVSELPYGENKKLVIIDEFPYMCKGNGSIPSVLQNIWDAEGVYQYLVEPELHEFAAFTFEDVCRESVKELQKKNALPFRYLKMGRWMGKTTVRDKDGKSGLRRSDTEIDLLAVNPRVKEYLAGECRFKNSPFIMLCFLKQDWMKG